MDFTDRELAVMNVLWDEGSATVHEARDSLDRDLHYTSVLTLFQTLEDKGRVRHEKEGRAYRYYPTVDREEAEGRALSYLMERIFRDSPERLVSRLVESRALDAEERERLCRVLEGRED